MISAMQIAFNKAKNKQELDMFVKFYKNEKSARQEAIIQCIPQKYRARL